MLLVKCLHKNCHKTTFMRQKKEVRRENKSTKTLREMVSIENNTETKQYNNVYKNHPNTNMQSIKNSQYTPTKQKIEWLSTIPCDFPLTTVEAVVSSIDVMSRVARPSETLPNMAIMYAVAGSEMIYDTG